MPNFSVIRATCKILSASSIKRNPSMWGQNQRKIAHQVKADGWQLAANRHGATFIVCLTLALFSFAEKVPGSKKEVADNQTDPSWTDSLENPEYSDLRSLPLAFKFWLICYWITLLHWMEDQFSCPLFVHPPLLGHHQSYHPALPVPMSKIAWHYWCWSTHPTIHHRCLPSWCIVSENFQIA